MNEQVPLPERHKNNSNGKQEKFLPYYRLTDFLISSNSPQSKPPWLRQDLHVCDRINLFLSHSICIPPLDNSNYVHYIICRSLTGHFVYTVNLEIFLVTASSVTSPNTVKILLLITTIRNTLFNLEIEFLNIIYTRGFP